jgi:membrane-associated phospholipid phosphatase
VRRPPPPAAAADGPSSRPAPGPVTRWDGAVDGWFEAHLRGKRAVDLLMYGASAAGDHSVVWLALAGWEGWRAGQGWRALGRAGAALGAESVLVNGLVKLVFRRRRPESAGPRPLPLRVPRTSSFPSGHASAAFFAAALLRDGAPCPLVYLAAVAVASSRVHVGMHHASDVLAGAAVGAALGEITRHMFPILPPGPRRNPPARHFPPDQEQSTRARRL